MEPKMGLKENIMADMKSAMKNRESVRVQALRMIYADCKNKEIEIKKELEDSQVLAVIKKQIKQYEETIEESLRAGNAKGVQESKERLKLLKSYLPKELSEKEMKHLVDQIIQKLKPTSVKQMGEIMKALQSSGATAGADNRRLSELVRERLKAL